MLDISSHAINSYQKGQSVGQWVDETAASQKLKPTGSNTAENAADLSVSISRKHQIFDWIAVEFQTELAYSGRVAPIAQALFDYGLINLSEQKIINELSVMQSDSPLLDTARTELSEATSFQHKKALSNIVRLFSTIEAAASAAAA